MKNEDIENPAKLPKDWKSARFEEFTENFDGKRKPLSSKYRENFKGEYRYYGACDIIDYVKEYIFDGEYLLIGEDGANLLSKAKPLAFSVKGKFWVNNHAHIVKASAIVNLKYLEFQFNSLQINKYVTGTAQPKLSQSNLNRIPISICPLPEQRAIVSKIEQLFSELDNGIANLRLAQEQLKVYRQAVLKKAFEDLEKVPFSELVASSQNGIAKRNGKEGCEFKVLRLADVTNLEIDYTNPRYIKLTSFEIEKYMLFNQDLVCIRVNGSKNLVGKLIITNKKDESSNWAFCDHFIRVSLDHSKAVPKFYYYYFQTMEVRKYIHENMVSSAGQNTVSQVTIKSALVPIAPLSEQHAIVQEIETRLSVCDKMAQDIDEALEKAEALRQSILKKAFEGKLLSERELAEVRRAEDWEPAEVLLERIRAQRAGNGKR